MTLLKFLKYFLNFTEIISLITAIYVFRKNSNFKKIICYLLIITVAEIFGRISVELRQTKISNLLYNYIVIPIEFFFWYWFLLQHFEKKKEKMFVKTGMVILGVSFIVEWVFFYDAKAVFISLSYTLGNLILLLFILMYFKNLIHSKRILTFDKELEFWICCGLLLFYLGTFPMFGLYNYFLSSYPQELRVYYVVMLVLNSLMYLIFSFGMIWTKPK